MNLDTKEKLFQVIEGPDILKLKIDRFDRVEAAKVHSQDVTQEDLDMKYAFVMRGKRGRAYIKPIWSEIVYIYFTKYSAAEAAAAEGSKFLTIGVNKPKPGHLAKVTNTVKGLSSRKVFTHNAEQIPPGNIAVHETKLNPMSDHLLNNYQAVSLYTGIPQMTLLGNTHGTPRAGAEADIGGEMVAYALIQLEAEKYHREFLERLLQKDLSIYSFEWTMTQRMTDKEKAELDLIKEQIKEKKLTYMSVQEIRLKDGLPANPEGGALPGKINLTIPDLMTPPGGSEELPQ